MKGKGEQTWGGKMGAMINRIETLMEEGGYGEENI